ncbi:hypothetical protein [Atrimonas thermophila]|uniref:iron-sulfur cluster-binding protein n=1 Tax=Atrimonas thermophila TaxID=3064161 RepID=UPI00399CE298
MTSIPGDRTPNGNLSPVESIVVSKEERQVQLFRQLEVKLYVTTDDGSYGEKGFVTTVLERVLEQEKVDLVIAVGPVMMMKMTSLLTKKHGVPTLVSLNPIMVDGTGMCGCCRVSVNGQCKFTCVDGPIFDGHAVDLTSFCLVKGFTSKKKNAL